MKFEMNLDVDHLKRALTAVRRGLENPETLMAKVGRKLVQVNRDRHNAGLAPDGSKWKPLSPLTIGTSVWNSQGKTFRKNGTMSLATSRKVQEKRGRTGILNATNQMLSSFHYRPVGNTVTLGFDGGRDSDLAAWHNSGTKPYVISPKKAKALSFAGLCVKRVNHPGLPKRQLVGFPESDRRLTEEVVGDYLKVILNRVR